MLLRIYMTKKTKRPKKNKKTNTNNHKRWPVETV